MLSDTATCEYIGWSERGSNLGMYTAANRHASLCAYRQRRSGRRVGRPGAEKAGGQLVVPQPAAGIPRAGSARWALGPAPHQADDHAPAAGTSPWQSLARGCSGLTQHGTAWSLGPALGHLSLHWLHQRCRVPCCTSRWCISVGELPFWLR